MAIIPLMIRFAPVLGMIDMPDARKVHAAPIPRVGGIGVVIGALVSIFIWVPLDTGILSFIFGSVVLLIFGTWDDCKELGHYVKFIGQFIAVIAIVYWGDIWVSSFPFMGVPLSSEVGKPFSVIALVGMINAMNHSDGLDGLAGGESLLSLACISYLAYQADGLIVVMIAGAVIGGIFGFLRFNTHPAQVFMGDSGSQFLGLTVGVLAIQLTQEVNPALSMALPLLILGLPIIDILAVFAQRIYYKMNWFRASKNHIHHRLLELGFDHYQAVVIIYSIHALLVASAIFLLYDSDLLVSLVYLIVCGSVFVWLTMAKRVGWQANRHVEESGLTLLISRLKANHYFLMVPIVFTGITIPVYFLAGSLWIDEVPFDFGVTAILIAVFLLVSMMERAEQKKFYLLRLSVYVTAAMLVFLVDQCLSTHEKVDIYFNVEIGYFIILSLSVALIIRWAKDIKFSTTPTDYLMVFVVIAFGVVAKSYIEEHGLGAILIKAIILFYGCEVIINRGSKLWNGIMRYAVLLTLGIIGTRGLLMM